VKSHIASESVVVVTFVRRLCVCVHCEVTALVDLLPYAYMRAQLRNDQPMRVHGGGRA